MYNFVRSNTGLGFESRHIVLYGSSLGTAFTVDFASSLEEPVAAVVLAGAMASAIRTVCSDVCAARSLCCLDLFTSVDKVANIRVPVLLMQGTKDKVTPLSNAATLMDVMRQAGVDAKFVPIEGTGLQNTSHGHSYVYVQYNPVSLQST